MAIETCLADGIEPGNDGNRLVLSLIQQNLFGLGTFTLVESSEQGMLAQVDRAVREKKPTRAKCQVRSLVTTGIWR